MTLCTTPFTAHIHCVLQLPLHTYIVDSISDTLCSFSVARRARDSERRQISFCISSMPAFCSQATYLSLPYHNFFRLCDTSGYTSLRRRISTKAALSTRSRSLHEAALHAVIALHQLTHPMSTHHTTQPEMISLRRPSFLLHVILSVSPSHHPSASPESSETPIYFDTFLSHAHQVTISRPTRHSTSRTTLDTGLTLRELYVRDQGYDSGYESSSSDSQVQLCTPTAFTDGVSALVDSSEEHAQYEMDQPANLPISNRNSRAWSSLPTTGIAATHFDNSTRAGNRDSYVHHDQGALHLHLSTPLVVSNSDISSDVEHPHRFPSGNTRSSTCNRDSTLSYTQHDHGLLGGLRLVNNNDGDDDQDAESVLSFDRSRPVGRVHRKMSGWLGSKMGRVFRGR
jgi:hypothetical protein